MATFGEKLKAIRLSRDMSQEDIAKILNTTKQSISRYETGANSPRIDTVDFIADKLGIELSLLINDDYSTQDVLNYRRKNISIHPTDTYTQNTINILSKVTEDGKKEISNYADYIYSNEDYHLPQPPLTLSEDYLETYTNARAAAGLGAYNSSYEDGSYIRVKLSDTSDYDAIVDVKGNSMEPTIKDGDVAFVDFSFDQKDGEVYIVQHEDDTYIKRCYFESDKLTLKSDNPEYQDIVFQGLDEVRVIGKVTGWATPEK